MTGAVTALGIAVGGASLACYLLMTRSQKRSAKRGPSRGGPGPDGGSYAESNADAWSWFGSEHSTIDSSANPADGGGGHSGGGSDGGGDGGGGGGSD
jgi:hypothetical protein